MLHIVLAEWHKAKKIVTNPIFKTIDDAKIWILQHYLKYAQKNFKHGEFELTYHIYKERRLLECVHFKSSQVKMPKGL